jgi:hypothetical protein
MKIYGLLSDFAPVRQDASRTVISFDLQRVDDEHCTWHEVYFYHKRDGKPSLASIKKAIEADINRRTTERIVGTLTWNQKPVWLSAENQQDWKAAFDRALQTDGANLPLRFKIGEDQDGQPVYHTFTSLNAFTDFWDTCQRHIYQCLSDVWQMKDNIDWSLYATADAGGSAGIGE